MIAWPATPPPATNRTTATCSDSPSWKSRPARPTPPPPASAPPASPSSKSSTPSTSPPSPSLPKQKGLELARGDWVDQHENCCLIGGSGTGKTHVATAIGLSLCRLGHRVRFTTAAGLVTHLTEAQQQHRLDRALANLERLDLLIVDELGYLSFSRGGAELLFQVFADRYERRSLLITSNLPFGEWGQIFQGERMTAALLDRLTHKCHIFEMNGESYRFKESMKSKQEKPAKAGKMTK